MCCRWLGDDDDSNLVRFLELLVRGIWKRAVCRCDVSTLAGEEMKLRLGDLLLRHWPCSGRWGPCDRCTSPELDVSIRHPLQKVKSRDQ